MALLWADGFDQYGGSMAFLAQGGYATVTAITVGNNAANARTGNGYIQPGVAGKLRRALTNPNRTVGIGCGLMVTQSGVPNVNNNGLHFEVTSGSTVNRISIVPNDALGFTCFAGNVNSGASENNLYALNSWVWVEAKAIANSALNSADASIELRLQGDPVLIINGLNINGPFAFTCLGQATGSGATNGCRFDDSIYWDDSGLINNDFLGDRRCLTTMTDADTAEADWTPSAGTEGWSILDNIPPVDASYIEAVNPGDISEFQKEPVSINTNDVAGIVLFSRVVKTDAGTSTFRMGVHSGAFVENSPELSPGVTAGYFQQVFERDPNGDIPWTKANIDAATIRLTREQ